MEVVKVSVLILRVDLGGREKGRDCQIEQARQRQDKTRQRTVIGNWQLRSLILTYVKKRRE